MAIPFEEPIEWSQLDFDGGETPMPNGQHDWVYVATRVEQTVADRLHAERDRRGTSAAAILRDAIDDWLMKNS